MPDRRLVVFEASGSDPGYGEMFALPPGAATGIALPSFREGPTKPLTGTVVGEAFYEQNTRKGWVWDGSAWREIAASPVVAFNNEALLQADTTQRTGTVAVAADTGQLYVRQPAGWQVIGVKDYATAASLLTDSPGVGSLGLALDENTLWQMTTNGWRALTLRPMADTAAVLTWVNPPGTVAPANPQGAHIGDQAVALDVDVSYVRTASGWRPDTLWEETEANIRAATGWPMVGQEAIANDTGRTFVYTTGGWIEEPIQHYATEALLLAATPPDGTLAWSDDTQVAFTRAAGTWHRLQGPQISIGTTVPATPGAGDMFMNSTTNALQVSDGTAWHVPQFAGGVVGDVRQSLLTEAQFATALGAESASWVLCDGRSVAGTAYATVTGQSTVPDLRGAFLRMAGQNSNPAWNGGAVGFHEDTTRRPRNTDFTTNTTGSHTHSTSIQKTVSTSGDIGSTNIGFGNGWNRAIPNWTNAAGDHSHTITGGGDTETAPKHYSLNYFIKVD